MESPESIESLCARAIALLGTDRNADAEPLFQDVLARAPGHAPAREGYGFLLFAYGRYAEAAAQFAEFVRLVPESAGGHNNLSSALGQMGLLDDALASYERALAIDPDHRAALLNSQSLLDQLGRAAEALEKYTALVARFPEDAEVQYRAGRFFHTQGLSAESRRALSRAIELQPEFAAARWFRAMIELPLVFGPDDAPEAARTRFEAALADLDGWFDESRSALGHLAVGEGQPFYLAYHDRDNVALLSRYGDLCSRLMAVSGIVQSIESAPSKPAKLRVAVVCGFLRDHSVWTAVVRGWCAQIDRARIEIHLFHTGSVSDSETALARTHADGFHEGLGDVFGWSAALRHLRPDVIVYPEIGMDAMCARLASLRLAPVQAVAWGHPATSGLPTLDYFLSAAAFEPPDGASHYRERLVALPNLGCYYDPLEPSFGDFDWRAFDIDRDVPRLVCAGTPYKYLPEHDRVFVDIAKRLGACHLLFFVDKAPLLSRTIEDRLRIAFRAQGLDADRFVRFLPRQSRPNFFELMQSCDVYLDTIGFSGFNTAIQALECELPVVTCEGRFMRGRLASGILRTMGMDELVATDLEGYVTKAVRLCQDASYRLRTGRRIAAQAPAGFRDLAPVRALEEFLLAARPS